MTPGSAWPSWAPAWPPPASPATARPSRCMEWVPQCYGTPTRSQLGAFCVSEPDAGSDVSVVAHPGGVRRGDRRVGAQRHQGVDHQRRHRRRPRRRGRRRPGAEGPGPGQLRRAARHQGSDARGRSTASTASGRRTPPRSCWTTCGCRAGACSAARSGSTPSWPERREGGSRRREAAGDVDVRGHPAHRRRPGPRHRPGRLRVRARVRQGAPGLRPADHHEPGASPSSWPTWSRRSTPPGC